MRRLTCAAAALVLAVTACSLNPFGSSTSATPARTASPSGVLDAEVAMPAGFPADFPLYPHARLTAAALFASAGQTVWGMEWESTDAEAKVEAYYSKALNSGDWVLTNATFARKSDKNVHGTVAVSWNASVTRILVSLVAPS